MHSRYTTVTRPLHDPEDCNGWYPRWDLGIGRGHARKLDPRTELVLQFQLDARHRARVLSAGGLHAGQWLCVFPVTMHATARGRHFQLALALRLGLELPELLPVQAVAPLCGGCGSNHDAYAFHPGTCRRGNRGGLWTVRHDALQLMVVHVVRMLGYAVQSCSVGAGNWFGAAGWDGAKRSYKRADVVLPHFLGPGRHMFLDTAITDPAAGGALNQCGTHSHTFAGMHRYAHGYAVH